MNVMVILTYAQHLQKLSESPGYRRSTRYKSSDGSRPRFLAIHEVDDVDAFMGAQESWNTEWTKKIHAGAKTFETTNWQLFLDKGNPDEKLGK